MAAEGRGARCLGTALAGGDLGGSGAQGGGRRRARWLGRAGTGQPSPEPARLSQACAAGPKPATQALLRIRTNICVACCVCWGLVFFSRLKIGASRVPAGIPAPPAGWAWPGTPSLVPSCDLTAGDGSTKVSENDYGVKVPITALQEACQRRPGQGPRRGGGQPGGAWTQSQPRLHLVVTTIRPPTNRERDNANTAGAGVAHTGGCPGRSHVPAEG